MINGGNNRAFKFYKLFNLDNVSVQKKYSTKAASYYRETLRKSLNDESYSPGINKDEMPSLKEGLSKAPLSQ